MTVPRPLPVPDDLSADYWAAARRHVFTLARCSQCGWLALPPSETCAHCGTSTPAFRFEPVSGRGSVRSWTVVRRASLMGFADQVPYLLVDVELAEQPGLRLIGRLLDGPETVVHIDDPVCIGFEDLAGGVAIPAFTLATEPPCDDHERMSPATDGPVR